MVRGAADVHDVLDPDLLLRIRDGESSALGVLFDRYERDVRRLISRLGVQPGDVDDVVQATFLDVLAAAGRYDGRASAKAWLMGLAVIQVRRHRRSLFRMAARVAAWGREPSSSPTTPEESAATDERAERVRRALGGLSEKKREVLVLVTVEGLSGEEVSGLLGIPAATVWTRLHHARRELAAATLEGDA